MRLPGGVVGPQTALAEGAFQMVGGGLGRVHQHDVPAHEFADHGLDEGIVGAAQNEGVHPGIPHLAVQTPDLAGQDEAALRQLGRKLRSHPALLKGANVNFYELTGPDTVLEKTYERGVEDFTLACGTGTGAVVTVLTLLGKVSGRNVRVRMDGGELAVDAEAHDGRIENLYLTGPAALVCAGEILDKTILDLIKKQEEKA